MAEPQQILIVEDDFDLAKMLEAYFSVQSYTVKTAAWGEDALRIAHEEPPDLVVLDIRLPDIDGYEVCRRLRADRRTQDIPIIFLTEKRDRVDKLQGLELGVVDYITKPFDIQELRLRVRNALQRAVQQPLTNPVTNMPEGVLVDERLNKLLFEDDWAILAMSIAGLDAFREKYGFVASDDVLRAVSLMMNNAMRESGSQSDYIGHLDQTDFIIIADKARIPTVQERIEIRIRQSMEYFYPLKDREKAREEMESKTLALTVGIVDDAGGPFADVAALKEALQKSRQLVESEPDNGK
ncbi:response regulator [Chloroflexota bacterium]